MRFTSAFSGLGLLVAGLLCVASVESAAQRAPSASEPRKGTDKEAIDAARRLMAVSGVAKQFEATVPAMMAQISQAFVKMQPQHEAIIRETFAQISRRGIDRKEELFEEIAKLYARSIGTTEMKELIRFFSSPAGRRFIDVQLTILPEAMKIGQKWGEKIGREIESEMRNELRKKGIPI